MTVESALSPPERCPQCGSSLSATVDGLCGACLLRLAAPDSAAFDEAPAPGGILDGWPSIAGQRIGNYELLGEVARGGMGVVYRARQIAAGRTVALKVMLPYLLHMPGMLDRFRQEVEAVSQLDHPGILPIYEVGEYSGLPFFSMKYADGGTLDGRMQSLSGNWHAIAAIIAKVARAVEHAHQRGVLHRDIKPANILFDAQDEPMVADFGLARFRAQDRGLTLPASALGSPHYMAPEQVSAQFGEIGAASDVYSLGAVLYEMLTGKPPITGDDALKILRLVPTQVPVSGTHTLPDMPVELDAIAMKCLAKRPEDRYASAEELALDLERWLAGGTVDAQRQRRSGVIRKRLLRAGAVLLLLAAIPGGISMLGKITKPPAPLSVPSPAAQPRTVAVLSFRNLSGDANDDYLSSSVTDDLLYELRQVESLAVIPFRINLDTSRGFQPGELASQFGAQMALEGDFRRDEGGLEVRARLWDAQAGKQLWEYEFETPDGDVLDLRYAIATTLVTRLQIELGNDLKTRLSHNAVTASPEAYDRYLRARYLVRWRREETLAEAARLLHEAIAIDPRFSRAHSALAYTYALWVGDDPPEGDHWQLAEQFARSAIALDVNLGEAYAVLGDIAGIRGDLIDAELQFRQAMEVDANDPATLHLYTIHLCSIGRLRAAADLEQRSVALDSTSPQPMMWLAMLTTLLGDVEASRRLWQKTDDLGAARPLAAALTRLSLGQSEFLPQWYSQNWASVGFPPPLRNNRILASAIVDGTGRDAALEWLRQAEPGADPFLIATHYALLGDLDQAFRLLETHELAEDENYFFQLVILWLPRLADLRRDPRFAALMEREGFVDYWRRFGTADLCTLEDNRVQCH